MSYFFIVHLVEVYLDLRRSFSVSSISFRLLRYAFGFSDFRSAISLANTSADTSSSALPLPEKTSSVYTLFFFRIVPWSWKIIFGTCVYLYFCKLVRAALQTENQPYPKWTDWIHNSHGNIDDGYHEILHPAATVATIELWMLFQNGQWYRVCKCT